MSWVGSESLDEKREISTNEKIEIFSKLNVKRADHKLSTRAPSTFHG